MMIKGVAIFLAASTIASASIATTSEPALTEIRAAEATSLPETTNSNVKGLVFDRFYQVWLENIVCASPEYHYLERFCFNT